MIDTKELRRLTQAATPGPDGVSLSWITLLQDFQQAANPAAISELLDRLEAAESDALEQARLNGMGASREAALMAKLAATETAWKVSDKSCHDLTEKVIPNLRDQLEAAEKSDAESLTMYRKARDERDALHAKVSDLTINVEYLGNLKKSYEELIGNLQDERDKLRAQIEAKENALGDWLYANAPGGWIDNLRVKCDALRAELTDLRNSMTFRTSLIGRIEAEREDLHALIAAVKKQVNAEFRLRMKKEIECNTLRAKIETAENDAAHQKAFAASAVRVAEGWERKCRELRAKIEAMERQAPAMWANSSNIISARISTERGSAGDQHTCSETKTAYHDTPLYLAPGAKGE